MGRAIIRENRGAGLYSVTLIRDTERADQMALDLQNILDALQNQRSPELDAAIAQLQSSKDEAKAILNSAVDAYSVCQFSLTEPSDSTCDAEKKAMDFALNQYREVSLALNSAVLQKETLEGQILAVEKELTSWTGCPPGEEVVDLWCADISDTPVEQVAIGDFQGHGPEIPVGTVVSVMDVYGANGLTRVIRPNYGGGATYQTVRDGIEMPVHSMRANQAYWNYGVVIPMQAWKPQYRTGEIVEMISPRTARVSIDDWQLGDRDLLINMNYHLGSELESVDIDYMGCTHPPFVVGDRVVVEFTNRDPGQPKVIGFVDHPKACVFPRSYWVFNSALNATQGWHIQYDDETEAWTVTQTAQLGGEAAWYDPQRDLLATTAWARGAYNDTTNELQTPDYGSVFIDGVKYARPANWVLQACGVTTDNVLYAFGVSRSTGGTDYSNGIFKWTGSAWTQIWNENISTANGYPSFTKYGMDIYFSRDAAYIYTLIGYFEIATDDTVTFTSYPVIGGSSLSVNFVSGGSSGSSSANTIKTLESGIGSDITLLKAEAEAVRSYMYRTGDGPQDCLRMSCRTISQAEDASGGYHYRFDINLSVINPGTYFDELTANLSGQDYASSTSGTIPYLVHPMLNLYEVADLSNPNFHPTQIDNTLTLTVRRYANGVLVKQGTTQVTAEGGITDRSNWQGDVSWDGQGYYANQGVNQTPEIFSASGATNLTDMRNGPQLSIVNAGISPDGYMYLNSAADSYFTGADINSLIGTQLSDADAASVGWRWRVCIV